MSEVKVVVEGVVEHLTARAILLKRTGDKEPEWLPLSQVESSDVDLNDSVKGEHVTLEITEWIAKEKGWA